MTRLVSVAAIDYGDQASLAFSFIASNGSKARLKADDCGRTDPVPGGVTGGVAVESRA